MKCWILDLSELGEPYGRKNSRVKNGSHYLESGLNMSKIGT